LGWKKIGKLRNCEIKKLEVEEPVFPIAAARVFLLATAAFYIIFSWLCDSWLMAALYTFFLFVMFLTLSRIVSECGVPFVQAGWLPGDILQLIFGPAAIGPKPLTIITWGTGVVFQDPRECLMPYVATAVKTADDAGVNLRKLFWFVCGVVLLALAVSFFVTFYTHYNFSPMGKWWASAVPPRSNLEAVAKQFSVMKSVGIFERSEELGPLARMGLSKTNPVVLKFLAAGFVATLGLSFLRFRFSRFPLHPVLFVLGGTYPAIIMWGSFLIGWFVKTLVVRFGGGGVFQRLKPLFVGLIAGELFMVGFNAFINFAYYFAHNARPPVHVRFFPW